MQTNADQLIADHVEVARRIAMKVARRCPDHVQREDLIAAGMVGLTEAARRFDDSRAEPFIGFAERRIRGAVLDQLRCGDMLTRRARQLSRKVKAAVRTVEASGASATDQQVAHTLGVSIEDYRRDLADLANAGVESLDDTYAQEVSRDAAPDEAADQAKRLRAVRDALGKLGQRDAQLLALHFLEEMSYAEVGAVLGITPSRVCQLMARAMERMRALVGVPCATA